MRGLIGGLLVARAAWTAALIAVALAAMAAGQNFKGVSWGKTCVSVFWAVVEAAAGALILGWAA